MIVAIGLVISVVVAGLITSYMGLFFSIQPA